jgi:Tol biopolymer transport system component
LAVGLIGCKSVTDADSSSCEILIEPASIEIEAGNSTTISIELNKDCSSQKIKWESSNKNFVTIKSSDDSSIKVVAKKEGEVKIKAMNEEKSETISSVKVKVSYTPKFAFLGNKNRNYDVYFLNSNKIKKRFTNHNRQDYQPNWFSDGKRLAFVSNRTGKAHIYSIKRDGSIMENLTSEFDDAQNFSISPDNKWIAFTGKKDGFFDIYKKNINTGEIVRLTHEGISSGRTPGDPTWSPDGNKIAFETHRDGNWEVYTMNADGSNKQNISNSTSTSDGSPSWSPDGDKIIFVSGNSNITEIYKINTEGENKQKLTNEGAKISNPSWSPDGDKIIFNKRPTEGGKVSIYTMNKDGSNLETTFRPSEMSIAANPSWRPETD